MAAGEYQDRSLQISDVYREVREVKEVVSKILDYVKCDWCQEPTEKASECSGGHLMDTNIEITAELRCFGYSDYFRWKINDLCFECSEKLKLALIEMGITIEEDEF